MTAGILNEVFPLWLCVRIWLIKCLHIVKRFYGSTCSYNILNNAIFYKFDSGMKLERYFIIVLSPYSNFHYLKTTPDEDTYFEKPLCAIPRLLNSEFAKQLFTPS